MTVIGDNSWTFYLKSSRSFEPQSSTKHEAAPDHPDIGLCGHVCAFGNLFVKHHVQFKAYEIWTSLQYSCPEAGLDFQGNDLAQFNDVANWQECGKMVKHST